MKKRWLAAALLVLVLVPGCLAPKALHLSAEDVYKTPVLNGYALFYDLTAVMEAPLFLPACLAGGFDKENDLQILAWCAMPIALVGSLIGGTLTLPFSLLFFGGKMVDHH